jgi:hypothetical protein
MSLIGASVVDTEVGVVMAGILACLSACGAQGCYNTGHGCSRFKALGFESHRLPYIDGELANWFILSNFFMTMSRENLGHDNTHISLCSL